MRRPPVLADHQTGDLVAEDEPQDSRVAGVRFDRLLHRGPGLGCHLLPASPVSRFQIPRVIPPNPHKELQPRLLGKIQDLQPGDRLGPHGVLMPTTAAMAAKSSST
jgi:hypothetical protein